MAGNTDPIYSRSGDIQSHSLAAATLLGPTANTAQDGTGTIYPIWTADATNGGFLQRLVCDCIGIPAATVMRVYISNTVPTVTSGALVSNTSLNTWKIVETALPNVTAVSQTAATAHIEVPINMAIPAGFKVSVSFGTASGAATSGWSVVGIGGKY